MNTLTIPDVDDGTFERLADRAERYGRSAAEEVRALLDREFPAGISREQVLEEAEATRRSLVGRYTGDPIAEIREDRDYR